MICAHQQEYDEAINASNNAGESTAFIEFMLSTIKASLTDALNMRNALSDGTMDKAAMRWKQIKDLLQTHAYIMNADVRTLCSVSSAPANRILTGFATDGKLSYSKVEHSFHLVADLEYSNANHNLHCFSLKAASHPQS